MDARISISFAGLAWKTPLCLASGNAGFGHELAGVYGFPFDSVGAICLKGTTAEARDGNLPERIWETPEGLLNSVGLENPGVDAVIAEHLPRLSNMPPSAQSICYIANLCGSTVEEYASVAKKLGGQPEVAALEVNISCPNVKQGGSVFGNSPDLAAEVVAACRAQTDKPLIVKLSPNQTDIAKTAERCILEGANALSAINTVSGMVIDIERSKPVLGGGAGGLSGSAIRPIALLKVYQVWQVAQSYKVPIIGQGGVQSAQDVIAFFMAGASACAIGTGLAKDTQLPRIICKDLIQWLRARNIDNIAQLTGTLVMP